ncbi:uncharacterized protein LOC121101657 [Ursus maritimus]|uniref:Uncharacterized protein LOC121101657 n=1 Tax=Ursus maritimus TaxID=29073 RepID=A0A8M1FDQ3_URSMA|nr:uncharacterized protein LOC121101657 [Ursus maritimus]
MVKQDAGRLSDNQAHILDHVALPPPPQLCAAHAEFQFAQGLRSFQAYLEIHSALSPHALQGVISQFSAVGLLDRTLHTLRTSMMGPALIAKNPEPNYCRKKKREKKKELLQKNPEVLCLQEGGKVVKCSADWTHGSASTSSDVCFSLRGYLPQEQGDSRDCPATQAVFASQGIYPTGYQKRMVCLHRGSYTSIPLEEEETCLSPSDHAVSRLCSVGAPFQHRTENGSPGEGSKPCIFE